MYSLSTTYLFLLTIHLFICKQVDQENHTGYQDAPKVPVEGDSMAKKVQNPTS